MIASYFIHVGLDSLNFGPNLPPLPDDMIPPESEEGLGASRGRKRGIGRFWKQTPWEIKIHGAKCWWKHSIILPNLKMFNFNALYLEATVSWSGSTSGKPLNVLVYFFVFQEQHKYRLKLFILSWFQLALHTTYSFFFPLHMWMFTYWRHWAYFV